MVGCCGAVQRDRQSRGRCAGALGAGDEVTELSGDFEGGGDNPAAVMSIRFTIIDEGSGHPNVAYEDSLSRRSRIKRISAGAGSWLRDGARGHSHSAGD